MSSSNLKTYGLHKLVIRSGSKGSGTEMPVKTRGSLRIEHDVAAQERSSSGQKAGPASRPRVPVASAGHVSPTKRRRGDDSSKAPPSTKLRSGDEKDDDTSDDKGGGSSDGDSSDSSGNGSDRNSHARLIIESMAVFEPSNLSPRELASESAIEIGRPEESQLYRDVVSSMKDQMSPDAARAVFMGTLPKAIRARQFARNMSRRYNSIVTDLYEDRQNPARGRDVSWAERELASTAVETKHMYDEYAGDLEDRGQSLITLLATILAFIVRNDADLYADPQLPPRPVFVGIEQGNLYRRWISNSGHRGALMAALAEASNEHLQHNAAALRAIYLEINTRLHDGSEADGPIETLKDILDRLGFSFEES